MATASKERKKITAAAPVEAIMKTGIIPPTTPKTAQDAAAELDEEVVLMSVPKSFIFTDDGHRPFHYAAGAQEMPVSHSQHWYVKAQGVKPFKSK